jgi:multidrug efflux pump subunit AcrA (membrane-fusion protein)
MSTVVAILLFIYLGYQIYNSSFKKIQTETASYASGADFVQATGTAIRKEILIEKKVNGVIDYIVSDGGKVASGSKIANIYENDQTVETQRQLARLDAEIASLQKLGSPGNTYAANLDSNNKRIYSKLNDLLSTVHSGEYNELGREDLQYLLNERQIVTSKVKNFNTRLSVLQAQRGTLAASSKPATGFVKAPFSGYFISKTDGFESVFDYSNVLKLTPEELKSKQKNQPAVQDNVIGKVCQEFDWYFACVVPAEQAVKFHEGQKASVQFPFSSSEAIPVTIAAVNQANKDSEAAIILRSGSMNSSIASIRNAMAQIQIDDYTGIRISQKSIHFETVEKTVKDKNGKTSTVKKEVKGVFVIHGSEIQFRQIIPLFSTENYVICKVKPNPVEIITKSSVKLFDEVVVEGTDLYDGKVIA